MSDYGWRDATVDEVRVGDRIVLNDIELTVSRIDQGFFGNPTSVAFVEDTEERWLKVPAFAGSEVQIAT